MNGQIVVKTKFIKKYMRIAREVGEYENPCYSRKIGVVIVDPVGNKILGTGYNGPPPGTPHCDDKDFLVNYFLPQLTPLEKINLIAEYHSLEDFVEVVKDCRTCPRRYVNAASGQRNELCSCGHAERHAITNTSCSLYSSVMFCWCGVPCLQCTDAIIQAGVKRVYCLKDKDYHSTSRWLFLKARIPILEHEKSFFDE